MAMTRTSTTISMMQHTSAQFWSNVSIGIRPRLVVYAYLKTADEAVGHVVLEQMSSLVVNTGPAPHVFVVVLCFALIEDSGTDTPHDDAKYEESDSEDGVVSGDLFSSMVTSSPVGHDDDDGHEQ